MHVQREREREREGGREGGREITRKQCHSRKSHVTRRKRSADTLSRPCLLRTHADDDGFFPSFFFSQGTC